MAVGVQVNQGEINQAAGAIARGVFSAFQSVAQFKAYLDATPDEDLTSMGFTSGDVATLKTAFADLANLGEVFNGVSVKAQPYDYRTFPKRLLGTGLY